jgi:transposase
MSQANDFNNAIVQHQVHKLSGSPLLWQIINALQIEQSIDEHCPGGKQAVSNGQAALAVLLTRLLKPKALYKIAPWLKASGIEVLLKHEADAFTDDALGRLLDALSPATETLWTQIIGQALQQYPAMAEQVIQYDITSCYFEGSYEDSELVQYGYSRDHRPDAKQMNLGLSLTGQSGLPLLYELLAGNTADNQTPFAHLAKLKQQLKTLNYPFSIVMVSDRAMLNRQLVAGYLKQKQHFVGPWTPPEVRDIVRSVPEAELMASPLAFQPQSAQADAPPTYYGVMREWTFAYDHQQANLQVLVLYSRGKARLDAKKRQDHLDKLISGLTTIQHNLNRLRYKRYCYVQERIHALLRRYPAARKLVTWSLKEDAGLLKFTFEQAEEALAEAAHMDGRYALVTNSDLSADALLIAFKQQSKVEGRFRIIKGPIPIRPIHLRKADRIEALVFLTMLALVIYSILEWRVRQRTAPRKRPWTGRAILEAFEEFSVVLQTFRDGSHLWLPPPLSDDQHLFWNALNLPSLSVFLANLELDT